MSDLVARLRERDALLTRAIGPAQFENLDREAADALEQAERDLRECHVSEERLRAIADDERAANFRMRQEVEQAERLRAELGEARRRLDGADCTHREGGDTRHCRLDRPCWRCRADRLRALLADVEWRGVAYRGPDLLSTCPDPKCRRTKEEGHAPDCRLAAALKDAR